MINQIFNEDCLATMGKMPNNSIDLVVTSPPYDSLRNYNGYSFNFEVIARELRRVLKDGGVIVWIVNDATENKSETLTSFRQAIFFKDIGLNVHDTMIWRKPNFSNPSKTRYHQVFEYMFIISKGEPKTFNPIIDRKNICANQRGTVGKNSSRAKDGSMTPGKTKVNREFGMRHNVWDCITSGQENMGKPIAHPATFPIKLIKDHISSWSNEGDTVYDPFIGSGTTAVAAKGLMRNYIGSEVSETYFKICQERLK